MLRGGDELSHSQEGNNNAYCQDNEISWLDWKLDPRRERFLDFVAMVVGLKRNEPVLHRPRFFQGRPIRGTDVKDIVWLEPSGDEMSDEGWSASFVRCIGVFLAGDAIAEVDEHGERLVGNSLLLLLNADAGEIHFALPTHDAEEQWQLLFDTAVAAPTRFDFQPGETYPLQGRSVTVLRLVADEEPDGTSPKRP